jgi:hypothetical protein
MPFHDKYCPIAAVIISPPRLSLHIGVRKKNFVGATSAILSDRACCLESLAMQIVQEIVGGEKIIEINTVLRRVRQALDRLQ